MPDIAMAYQAWIVARFPLERLEHSWRGPRPLKINVLVRPKAYAPGSLKLTHDPLLALRL